MRVFKPIRAIYEIASSLFIFKAMIVVVLSITISSIHTIAGVNVKEEEKRRKGRGLRTLMLVGGVKGDTVEMEGGEEAPALLFQMALAAFGWHSPQPR